MKKKFIWLYRNNVDYPRDSFRYSYTKQQYGWNFLIDRFNLLDEPDTFDCVNIVKPPVYNLENLSHDWEDRFFAVCDQAAEDVYATAGDRKITVMYSGGTDSACLLVALMKSPRFREYLESGRFEISMTTHSIDEYPLFFWKFILPNKIPLVPMNYDAHMREDSLVAIGNFGDYIAGSAEVMNITRGVEISNEKWPVFKSFIAKDDPNGEVVKAYETIIRKAPFTLETAQQIQWWFNNAFHLQSEMVRPYIWSRITDLSTMLNNEKIYKFFYHEAFTTFSFEYMSTRPLFNNTYDVKIFNKKYVADFSGDPGYLGKKKVWSQRSSPRMVYKTELWDDLSWDMNTKIYSGNEQYSL